MFLQTGQAFLLDLNPTPGSAERVNLPHPEIIEAAGIGATLLLDDGKLRLRVTDVYKRQDRGSFHMTVGMIAALDTTDLDKARCWATAIAPHCSLFKLGLEFFLANGAAGYRAIAGRPVFLDLKLHDIPVTVAGAVRAVLPLRPRMLTIHAAGTAGMITAARHAAEAVSYTHRACLGPRRRPSPQARER